MLVGGAGLGQPFEIENLAEQQTHIDERHDVERLENFRRLVGTHFGAPGIGGDAGE
jgi:hypothetical protein